MAEAIKILIVEDEIKIANSLKQGLEELQYKVDIAYDGLIGQKLFLSNSYDIVLLDLNLPGINGLDLCRIIRQYDQKIPVLMLTAFGSTDDKVQGFDMGADDYLVKPFDFKELLARLNALLRRDDIVPDSKGKRISGMIVETEAYLGEIDRAAHSYGGRRTARNESTYLVGGHVSIRSQLGSGTEIVALLSVPEAA